MLHMYRNITPNHQVVGNGKDRLFEGTLKQCEAFLKRMPLIDTTRYCEAEIVPPGQVRVGIYEQGCGILHISSPEDDPETVLSKLFGKGVF